MSLDFRTTCPHCTSVFRLGGDQLGAAGGWVQCGVCGTAFDARPALLRLDGSPPPPLESILRDAARVKADAARSTPQRDTSLDLPSIILIDPDLPAPGEPAPLHDTPQTAAPAQKPPTARIEYASPLPQTRQRRPVMPWVWGIAALLLLATLFAQTTYFLRDTLVSRLPQTRPAFEQACAALGCKLSLPKNLGLLQIIGSDLQTEADDQLRLSLTLGNRADHVQAWPVLVLTLTDQRDQPLARRSFAPSEYLGDTRRIAAGMPPRSEQTLSLPLTVSKLAPMGFNLKLVY